MCTANNTISIIFTGPLAKNIADQHEIDPRKSASVLDLFFLCARLNSVRCSNVNRRGFAVISD